MRITLQINLFDGCKKKGGNIIIPREVMKNNMLKEILFYIIIIDNHSSIANDAYEIMLCVIETAMSKVILM